MHKSDRRLKWITTQAISEQKTSIEIHNDGFSWNLRIIKYQEIGYYSARAHQTLLAFPAIMGGNVSKSCLVKY